MNILIRGIIIYFFLFILLRIAGKRAVNSSTPFGLVLILLVSSSVSDAIKDEDRSLTSGLLLAITLIGIHRIVAFVKTKGHRMKRVIEDVPTLLVKDGEVFESVLRKSRVGIEDILSAAREQKLTKVEDIRYAILEIGGSITVIPKEE
jgi:uncharacterized membrane protein YcaP (DUF421 family)